LRYASSRDRILEIIPPQKYEGKYEVKKQAAKQTVQEMMRLLLCLMKITNYDFLQK